MAGLSLHGLSSGRAALKHITVMIKPASSICDMRCNYCFYKDVAASRQRASYGFMSRETALALINNVFCVLSAGDNITFAFQGGEPGLVGLEFFSFFIGEADKAMPPGVQAHYALQTNGLMIDDNWCKLFKANNFLVGLSLDGYIALHNQNRIDSGGKGTFSQVIKAKKLLELHNVDYNILSVITAETARHTGKLWDFILREKIRHIQFIPCLEPLNGGAHPKTALTGERFYQFYSTLFRLWKREAVKGNFISVRLFNELAALLVAGQRAPCGLSGRCSPQIIIEADGSAYPCDFYVLDGHYIGNLADENLQVIFEKVAASDFLQETRQRPKRCTDCTHNIWCKGGCKRMAGTVYGDSCGMRLFLDECLEDFLAVVCHSIPSNRPLRYLSR